MRLNVVFDFFKGVNLHFFISLYQIFTIRKTAFCAKA